MRLEKIIAENLGEDLISVIKEKHRASLIPDIKNVIIETSSSNRYLLYIVREPELQPSDDIVDLGYLSSLAGFYNARYLYEFVKYEGINFPIGNFQTFLKPISHKKDEYSIFAIKLPKYFSISSKFHHNGYGSNRNNEEVSSFDRIDQKLELTLEEAFNVAEKLSSLHERCLPERKTAEGRTIIDENYQLVNEIATETFHQKVNEFLEATLDSNGKFFKNPDDSFEKFNTLFKSTSHLSEAYPECNLPKVLCHGDLTGSNITFGNHREVILINHWENVHYGSAAEDLSYLILTSLNPKDRRNNYLKIFRRYFYTLVDTRHIKFKLHEMKEFYLAFMKYAVFFSFPNLALILKSEKLNDHEKQGAVQRWESVLDDAFEYESGGYVSDNEHPLTAQNSENRDVSDAVLRTRHSTDYPPFSP
jgi:thiamine kinase-like enzyme